MCKLKDPIHFMSGSVNTHYEVNEELMDPIDGFA